LKLNKLIKFELEMLGSIKINLKVISLNSKNLKKQVQLGTLKSISKPRKDKLELK